MDKTEAKQISLKYFKSTENTPKKRINHRTTANQLLNSLRSKKQRIN